ncbi:betaine--homocysteine S-methyltransferase 1-like isoform X2 [Patiria miniata]|uniref:Hcy-binding domain-containing protein n=1 Tax=Patiria miniata TaxID=46514 RepID=A0A914A7E6_PATMI|nr:betaine--homocysteine S-methyltransferase 1-like isoform X2 [Patiria miniata]
MDQKKTCKGLMERLRDGETVICAEGYLFVFERRGYLTAGSYVPEVVLEHPELVRQQYEEFVHAGSDVVLAFTEQIEWAVEAGADFIVGETFSDFEEALMAVKACKEFAKDIPCVVTMAAQQGQVNGKPATVDGVDYVDAFNKLAEAGADVVGLNCARGPATMLPIMEEAVKVCKAPLAAVPVMYRTTEENPNFMSSKDPLTGESLFPVNLDCIGCNRQDIHDFGKRVQELGIKYVGLCCGNSAHLTRSLAESLGRKPPASRYSADLKKHWLLGHDDKLPSLGQEFKTKYAPKLTKVEK